MYRRFMPADRGMLFEFEREAPVAFWMKNTYIPLDMIFIARDGSVTRIAANAEPLSEAIIPSGGPCVAVLELNGGVAARIGLRVGDKVRPVLQTLSGDVAPGRRPRRARARRSPPDASFFARDQPLPPFRRLASSRLRRVR